MAPHRFRAAAVWLGGCIAMSAGCHPGPGAGPPARSGEPSAPPAAAVRPVKDVYHGVAVEDPYRWLENGADPEVRAWSAGQNAAARAYLDRIPAIAGIRKRVTELMAEGSPRYDALSWASGRLFALKTQPPAQQAILVVMESAADPASERVLFDPNAVDPSGGMSIDFFEASFDGRFVAVSVSSGGSEAGDVQVIDVAGRHRLDDLVPRVNGGTAGGSVAWNADGTGFWYTRYPRPGERDDAELGFHQQVYFHALGTPTKADRYELGRDLPRIAEIRLESSRDGRFVIALVQKGDGGEFTLHLRDASGRWSRVADYDDRVVAATLDDRGSLWMVSHEGAPRGMVRRLALDAAPEARRAEVVVPELEDAIETDFSRARGIWTSERRLFVRYQQGGPNAVRVFDLSGAPKGTLPLLPISSVGDLVPLDGDDVLFRNESWLSPPAWMRWSAAAGTVAPTALVERSTADFSDCEVVRDQAVSKDGTRVPISILRRRGIALDGTHPTLLYGYGGYGLSRKPAFQARLKLWLERGGVYAVAHLRGGGEFGEAWHLQGNLVNKQNVFDDFHACARRLVDAGTTTPGRLAILGGSNGGLLMGAVLTQHPDCCRVVVSSVGVYDMMRVERTPNGAFNVPEFGTVQDPVLFKAMRAYSPYHNVRDGARYPAILMMTGDNDPRVDPWHSRKMVARLQAASASGAPILLRTSASSGHGIGTALSERIEESTDLFAFVIAQLGM